MRVFLLLVLGLCLSCMPKVREYSVIGLPTAAESIAQLLPPGADSCTISRVGAVADARRSLVDQVSHAGPVAWSAGAPFVAYAQAIQRGFSRGAYRAVVRVSDIDLARRYLENDAPVRVGFDEACPVGARNCWRAQVVDARTIRLSMGEWDSEIQGAELRCARMAREHPEAIEVGVSRHVGHFGPELGEQLVQLGYEVPGFESELVIEASEYGLSRTERVEAQLDSENDALGLIALLRGEADDWAAASRQRTRVSGDRVMFELGFVWEDLELAERDAQRIRQARALAAEDELPLAIQHVDVRNLDVVRHQLSLHNQRIQNSQGNTRRGHVRAAQALLEQTLRVFPADAALNRRLATLYLEELHDGAAAAELANNMLARNPRDAESWRVLRRRALSSVGAAALRDALVEDGVLDRRTAQDAADALVGFSAADYEDAEGAVRATLQLARFSRRVRPLREAQILPLTSLIESLLNVVDEDGPSQHVFFQLHVDAELEQGGWGNPDGRVLTWQTGSRSVRYGASLTDAPLSVRDVANGIFHRLNDVDVELLIAAVPMGRELSDPALSSVRIRGRIEEADFRLTHASVRVDWDAFARYIALPFAELEGRLFPPPDMSLQAEDSRSAEAIAAATEYEPVLECTASGVDVDCTVSPELDVTRRAWRRIVWPRVLGRSIPSP